MRDTWSLQQYCFPKNLKGVIKVSGGECKDPSDTWESPTLLPYGNKSGSVDDAAKLMQ